jgi:hypothetical protein
MQPTHSHLDGRLDTIEQLLRDHIRDSMAWRNATDIRIAENTEVTEQVRTATTAIDWIKKAIMWLGGLAVGIGGIIGLLQLLRPGIGPTP